MEDWFKRTPTGFVFAVEAKSIITLESKFSSKQTLIKRFYGPLEPLGEELACILFQLPRSMKKDTPFLKAAINKIDVDIATS